MNNAEKLIEFITNCPESTLTTGFISKELDNYGYERLEEGEPFSIKKGGAYYIVSGSSCIVAFTVGQSVREPVFKIAAAHTDSPAFKIKKSPTIKNKGYIKLNTESYGGLMPAGWFDRPLSFAGRIIARGESIFKPTEVLMDFKRPMITIPSLAIHLDRSRGKEKKEYDFQEEMLPVCGILNEGKDFNFEKYISKESRVSLDNILDYEFTVYNSEKGCLLGFEKELVSAPRLDDLLMVYCILEGIKRERSSDYINVAVFTDHEEVGSQSETGAKSEFIKNTFRRIAFGLKFSEEEYFCGLSRSVGVSADLSHGYHPNYGDKYDITNFPVLNGGIVIKYAASRSYSTESYAAAVFKEICGEAGVKTQSYYNRSGQKGGSTIGGVLSAALGIPFTDMGLSVLAMHSARELCGSADVDSGVKLFKTFYNI